MQLKRLLLPLLSLLIGLAGALAIAFILGESPVKILIILTRGVFGSATQVGYALFYATPLIMTGLSVAWAFRAGLFNIGAEGQMTMGGLAMTSVGIIFSHWSIFIALPIGLLTAFVVAGFWAWLAGWMKARRGCHEVLSTILLNFIAYGIAGFFIISVFKNPEAQTPETLPIGEGYKIAAMAWLGGVSPLNYSLVLALLLAVIYWFIFRYTKFGFHQKMVGGAYEVGERAGINMSQQTMFAMFVAGGIAGLAGSSAILGSMFKLREGFTSGAGFVGIAVALLGRNTALGVVLAAFLFGALTKGALDLDLDTEKVTRDLAIVIQALIVLSISMKSKRSSL